MTPQVLLFTLAAIGISETAYLIRKKRQRERPVCVIGDDCHLVLESKYSNLFGLPNEIIGFLFYLVISFLTAFLVIGLAPLKLWELLAKLLILLGTLMSGIFTYLQWRVIRAWCFWCLMSAATIFLMAAIVFLVDLK